MADTAGPPVRALVTSGPTRAPLDAVRFIMNTSTGALGAALASEGLRRGWSVDLVHGPGALLPQTHDRLALHPVHWLADLEPTFLRLARVGDWYRVAFHAMAVLDYAPREPSIRKRPSGSHWTVELEPTPKLIDRFPAWFPRALLVGFKLETGIDESSLCDRAAKLAQRSGARIVVANLLEWFSQGYRCLVVDGAGRVLATLEGRPRTAAWLWDFVEQNVEPPSRGGDANG